MTRANRDRVMVHAVRTICAMFAGVYLSTTGAKMPLEVVEKGVKKGVFFSFARAPLREASQPTDGYFYPWNSDDDEARDPATDAHVEGARE